MIAALLLALQLAAPGVLTVVDGDRAAALPLVSTPAGRAVPAELLATALSLPSREQVSGRLSLTVGRHTLELVDGAPFARVDSAVVPLAAAVVRTNGALLVPLQVVAELLPRLDRRLSYDARRQELRVASADGRVATSAQPPQRGGNGARSTTTPPAAASPAPSRPADRRRVIVVDAGHGGVDPGTSARHRGSAIVEKEIALAVARELRTALQSRGFGVVLTRDRDTLIALADRGPIANERHGDLFISLHVNAPNPRWRNPERARGFETYFLAEAKTEDARRVEQMENEAVRFETGASAAKNDPLSFIIHDMAQNEHLRESSELAAMIQRHLGAVHPGPDRGVKQAGFRVLVSAFMPAVLVELGFASNAEDAAFLSSRDGQRKLARAIADAAAAYLEQYERRVGAGVGGGR